MLIRTDELTISCQANGRGWCFHHCKLQIPVFFFHVLTTMQTASITKRVFVKTAKKVFKQKKRSCCAACCRQIGEEVCEFCADIWSFVKQTLTCDNRENSLKVEVRQQVCEMCRSTSTARKPLTEKKEPVVHPADTADKPVALRASSIDWQSQRTDKPKQEFFQLL